MKKGDYSTNIKAKKYQEERFSGNLKFIHEDEIEAIKSLLQNHSNMKFPTVIDIGAGTGRITKELITLDPNKIYALDQSKAMLDVLVSSLPKEHKNGILKTIISNSDDIPLNDNTVDLAVSMHLFKHLKKIKPTIVEVARTLNKGGLFLFDFLNSKSLVGLRPTSCYTYNLKYVGNLLSDAGLEIVDQKYIHTLGETIYQLINQRYIESLRKIDSSISGKLYLGTKIIILAKKR